MTPREIARKLLQRHKATAVVPDVRLVEPMNAEAVRRMFDALPPREIVPAFDGRLNSGDLWFLRQFRISLTEGGADHALYHQPQDAQEDSA